MKTLTGKILSSKPVPVDRARSLLSEFVNTDTGASQAVSAYLRRATAAFDELLRGHSKSQRRRDGDVKEKDVEKGEEGKGCVGDSRGGEGKKVIELKEEGGLGDGKKAKKKKKRERERERGSLVEHGSVVRDREGGIEAEAKEEEGRGDVEERRLKRKSGGDEEEKEVGTEERKQSKKKKKRRKDGGDDV